MAAEHKALLARLHAKPNKVDEVRSFLEDALPLAEDEEKTVSWYALQLDETTFGIFDTFAGDDGRLPFEAVACIERSAVLNRLY